MKFFKFVLDRSPRAKWTMAGAVVVGLISGSASVALLALIQETLELPEGASLVHLGLLFAAACVVSSVARVGANYLLVNLGQGLVADLRLRISKQILTTPLPDLERLGAPRLLAALTGDINTLASALLNIPTVCTNGAVVAGCFAYLAWLDVDLFLMLVAVLGLGIVTYVLPNKLGMRRFRDAREQQDILFGHFRSLNEGIKELKLHRQRRGAFIDLLETTVRVMQRLRVNAMLIYAAAAAWGHLLFFFIIGVLLYLRPPFISTDQATLMGYIVVLVYMMTPLQILLDAIPQLGDGNVAIGKLDRLGFSLGQSGGDIGRVADEESLPVPWRRLEMKGVTYSYSQESEEREFTLGPIDLQLTPGEVVFLIGGNGSGKTSLARLLVGLYSPDGGEVQLDGEAITESKRDAYRQLFSVVFDDFYLFDRLLGFDNVDERAQQYLDDLRISHKVDIHGGEFSTTDLSKGQKKRLALLTAYLEDRPIYLFDEWAADQDPVFKAIFYEQILAELKRRGKTVIVISHDDRYFNLADRIFKLEDGRLRFAGAWGELAGGGEGMIETDPDALQPNSRQDLLVTKQSNHEAALTMQKSTSREGENPSSRDPHDGRQELGQQELGDGQQVTDDAGSAADELALGRASGWHRFLPLGAITAVGALIALSLLPLRPPQVEAGDAPAEAFSAMRALVDLETISREPHPIGTVAHDRVRDHLIRRLEELGVSPEVQNESVITNRGGRPSVAWIDNVVARLEGTGSRDSAVMLVAHYDTAVGSPGASDDGAGVVTLLETLRALKAGPPLQEDVIFLFSDGEEVALLGALAFQQHHPWAKDVRLVLNFEARGTHGPSHMFETGPGTGPLVSTFASAAPRPTAGSYIYDIYRYLPNDTDFSVFKQAGKPGFNFAFIRDFKAYHSRLDTVDRLDLRSLQHHGSNALALTRAFGSVDLDNLETGADAVYFNLPLLGLITYSSSWVGPITGLAGLLLLAVIAFGRRQQRLAISRLLLGMLALPMGLVVVTVAVSLLHMAATEGLGFVEDEVQSVPLYHCGLGFVAIAVFIGFWRLVGRKLSVVHLSAGAAFGWLLALIAAGIYLPSSSYLLAWPLLCAVLSLAIFLRHSEDQLPPWTLVVGLLLCAAPVLMLWSPVISLVSYVLGLDGGSVVALVIGMVLSLLIPQLTLMTTNHRGWLVPTVLLALGLGLVLKVASDARYDLERPDPNSVFYAQDSNEKIAVWASFDGSADAWTSQFLTDDGEKQSLSGFFLRPRKALANKALLGSLPAPVVTYPLADPGQSTAESAAGMDVPEGDPAGTTAESDASPAELEVSPSTPVNESGPRRLKFWVESPRGAPAMALELRSMSALSSLVIDNRAAEVSGFDPPDGSPPGLWRAMFYGMPRQGFSVEVTVDGDDPLEVLVVDREYGLPELPGFSYQQRPPTMRPSRGKLTDLSMVKAKFILE